MKPAIVIGLSILGIIFLLALVALFVICRRRYCSRAEYLIKRRASETASTDAENDGVDVQWSKDDDEVSFPPDPRIARFEQMSEESGCLDDPLGLIPHCLEVLKTCHQLTDRLVAVTMKNASKAESKEKVGEIVTVARRITPRVDDLVRSMYPPLDAKLIEARATALLLSVNHLVLVAKGACKLPYALQWVDDCVLAIDDHLETLRSAAMAEELQSSPPSTPGSERAMLGGSNGTYGGSGRR
ncbi:transmembrane protein 98-like [Oscarella lobularis]|uniref:transmembrane protein 98-like n=1 Tax=Oscarella lobularis TaxID=121494 RepID=UPI003313A6CC